MENSKDDVMLIDEYYRPRSFFQRKINLTIPICFLLIVVFLSSVFIVTIVSLTWLPKNVCFVYEVSSEVKPEEPIPRQIYHSRPKRSLPPKKSNLPCISFGCCNTTLDPSEPWTKNRLPTNVYPVEYALALDIFELNEESDEYSGTVDIVIEVRSPTYDIILHSDILLSEITVSKRSSPNDIQLTVDCAVPFPNTQTLMIHLLEQLEVGSVYDVRIAFFRALSVHGTGIFENQFSVDQFGMQTSRLILTHFQPVHAREAFPCFDEPGFKAKFQLTVKHENDTRMLSNWDEAESFQDGDWIQTEYRTTPPIPTALIAFAMFYIDDFNSTSVTVSHPTTNREITINLWARKRFFENDNGIYVTAPLAMAENILTALLDIFRDIDTPVVTDKIDLLAVPEYPSDVVPHWGFIIFDEYSILYNPSTTTEIEHQQIALIMAKALAEQWYGNFISFRWWTDLWLQEAIANYLAYYAIEKAFPEWNIQNHFYVGELLPTMFDDSMSTSHPIIKSVNSATEIDELFDSIETTKATAILKMADYYMEEAEGKKNNTLEIIIAFLRDYEYGFLIPDEILSKYRIDQWDSLDFFDRWLFQSNYPKIYADLSYNSTSDTTIFHLSQTRFFTAHMYDNDLYPPETNPFGYIWFIPITCRFGNDSTKFDFTRTFFLDKETMDTPLAAYYKYFYCNTDFAGYYLIDYKAENWEELSEALINNHSEIDDVNRANLLNNAFLTAQTTEESYAIVKGLTQYLAREPYSDLFSWKTLSYHVNRMLDVLEYESVYSPVQKYFRVVVRKYYETNEANLWNDQGSFSEQILKNLILQLACRLQLQECIEQATLLWNDAYLGLVSGTTNHSVPNHARQVVYRTHFQNTYNDSEWITVESDYHYFIDIQERYHLMEALTQSRQPWHLYQLLYRDAEENQDLDVDLLEVLTLLARNPSGRELAWLYYRQHWSELQTEYERTNQRLGRLLIDITSTFEDEFHELELIDFLASTPGVNTNVDARFWALERANMNFWWIVDNSDDMYNSFELEP